MTARRPRLLRAPSLRGRLALALLAAPLVAGLLASPAGSPPTVRGDDLAAAQAQSQALQARIAANRQLAAQLSSDQANLTSQIQSTQASLSGVTANLTAVQARIDALSSQVAAVKARYDQLVGQLADLERQLADVQIDERARQVELAQRKGLLASRVRAAYRTDGTSMLETVFSAQSFADVFADVSSYMDIASQDRDLAGQVATAAAALASLEQTVQSTHDATEQLRQQAAAQKQQLDAQMAQLRQARAQLQALQNEIAVQLASQNAAYARMASNRVAAESQARAAQAALDSVNARIQALAAAAAARGAIPSGYSGGAFAWPMGGVISQPFGCTGVISEPPYGSCPHFHQGIDIVAPYGTPVRAAADGVIVWDGFMPAPDGAYDIEIAHSGSLMSLYGHLQAVGVAGVYNGAHVRQGQVIGYEGMTGNTTGPHLHFAIYRSGVPVNPMAYL